MEKPAQPPFAVFECFFHGIRFTIQHVRLFAVLSFFPFAITLASLVVMRFMDTQLTIFWFPVVQLPSSFVIGLQCALILRFIVLHEYPLVPEGEDKKFRNRAVTHAAIAYTAITYFVTGAYAGLVKLRAFLIANPETAAPYVPLAVAALVLLLWAARWFWLHVPLALEWPVRGFYARVGGWGGSLRIFALFALCSLTLNFIAGFLRLGITAAAGGKPTGFAAAFDDAVVAMVTVLLAVLSTCATAAAVKIMAGVKMKDIEV